MPTLEETTARITAFYAAQAGNYHEGTYGNERAESRYARLRSLYREKFKGQKVLEIASGTGYWTEVVAGVARDVLTTDANFNLVEINRQRLRSLPNIRFQVTDAYSLEGIHEDFPAAFSQHWWSHIPKKRHKSFLDGLHAKLQPGALVFFSDDALYPWDHPRRTDADGDLYETRPRRDGSHAEMIKNFPSQQEFNELLTDIAEDINYDEFQPERLWTLSYRLKQ